MRYHGKSWEQSHWKKRFRVWISVLFVSVGQNKSKIMDWNRNSIQQTNDARNNPRKSSHQSRNQFRFEWFWTNTNTFRFSLCMSFSCWRWYTFKRLPLRIACRNGSIWFFGLIVESCELRNRNFSGWVFQNQDLQL